MKLICHESNIEFLMEKLKPYSHIDVTLVEKGCEYVGLCYVFSMDNLDELLVYLSEQDQNFIYGYISDREYKIKPEDVMYIEGFSKEAYIHCANQQYLTNEKLYELEECLREHNFIRINKSMILNLRYVEYIMPDVQSRYIVVLKNKEKLLVTRKYVISFKNKWKGRNV